MRRLGSGGVARYARSPINIFPSAVLREASRQIAAEIRAATSRQATNACAWCCRNPRCTQTRSDALLLAFRSLDRASPRLSGCARGSPSAHCSAKLAISAAFRKNRYRFDATKNAFKSEQKTNEINTLHRRLHDHIEMQTVAFCTENKTTSRQCGAQPL